VIGGADACSSTCGMTEPWPFAREPPACRHTVGGDSFVGWVEIVASVAFVAAPRVRLDETWLAETVATDETVGSRDDYFHVERQWYASRLPVQARTGHAEPGDPRGLVRVARGYDFVQADSSRVLPRFMRHTTTGVETREIVQPVGRHRSTCTALPTVQA